MHRSFLPSLVTTASLAVAVPGAAFEKTATPIADTLDGPGAWNAAATCALVYYNRCTQWSLAWTGFGHAERIGVCADPCCPNSTVQQTVLRVFVGAPAGWGFTGTASITNVDANCCPTNKLAEQPWFPTGPFDVHNWNVPVTGSFAVVYTYGCPSPEAYSSTAIGTDHPSAGPTGPQACGLCYPSNRPNHSFYWGGDNAPFCPGVPPSLCPGLTFLDLMPSQPCAPQLLVDIYMSCPVQVEAQGWGRLKGLYR